MNVKKDLMTGKVKLFYDIYEIELTKIESKTEYHKNYGQKRQNSGQE